jgi:hypothetical protein
MMAAHSTHVLESIAAAKEEMHLVNNVCMKLTKNQVKFKYNRDPNMKDADNGLKSILYIDNSVPLCVLLYSSLLHLWHTSMFSVFKCFLTYIQVIINVCHLTLIYLQA